LRRSAQTWLTAGLMNLGAGAKTSAGYAYVEEAGKRRVVKVRSV